MSEVTESRQEKTPKLAEALCLAQAEFKPASFDSVNPHYKNKFASLSAIVSSTKDVLAKNGLSISHSVDGMKVITKLMHKSGEFITCTTPLILAKQDMQGLGSSITYARRYGMSAILNIVTDEDDDGNAASTPPESSSRSNQSAPKTLNNPKGFTPQEKSAFVDFKPKPISVKSKEPDTSFNFGANLSTETDVP
jgi:hypothetical protein